jgi:hypothetical protein
VSLTLYNGKYCLEFLEEVEKTIRGKASLARLEAALNVQYAEKYENKVFQYRWLAAELLRAGLGRLRRLVRTL